MMHSSGNLNSVQIRVVEENRVSVSQPKTTVRTFKDDFSVDYFKCPECGNMVQITHWSDGRGLWPNVGLPCGMCGRKWSVLRW